MERELTMKASRWRVLVAMVAVVMAAAVLTVPAQEAKEAAPASAADLSTRYRFQEKPTINAGPNPEGVMGPYRVAFRETIATTTERPQAAPVRKEVTIQATYQERPAEISPIDAHRVLGAVRRYGSVTIKPEPETKSAGPKLFEDLTVWYRDRPGDAPLILSLTPNRSLREREYLFAMRQIFFPDLIAALPELPIRIGDSYSVARAGMEAMLGGTVRQGRLTSKLQSINPDPAGDGTRRIAVFDILGRVVLDMGMADVHAQLRFACKPAPDQAAAKRGSAIFDAPGRITRLSIAYEIEGSGPPDGEGRPSRMRLRRELVANRVADEASPPLTIPDPVPKPDPENSWLTYDDPKGRFRFQHPQELQPTPPPGPDVVRLEHRRRDSSDVVTIQLTTKDQADPEKLRTGRFDAWREEGVESIAGLADWLPETDWPDRKVYRFEAAVTGRAPNGTVLPRAHFDGYVVLTGREEALYVEAVTFEDPPIPFRDRVEAMLKTFRLSGSAGDGPARADPPGAEAREPGPGRP
jgi:hypothetical protein